MRCFASARATGAGSDVLPQLSLYSPAGIPLALREIKIINTTNTACRMRLARFTTAGTPGATITGGGYNDAHTVLGVVRHAHSSTPPTLGKVFETFVLPAAIGAAVAFTYGAEGILIPLGTANGIGLVADASQTPQICEVTFTWDE